MILLIFHTVDNVITRAVISSTRGMRQDNNCSLSDIYRNLEQGYPIRNEINRTHRYGRMNILAMSDALAPWIFLRETSFRRAPVSVEMMDMMLSRTISIPAHAAVVYSMIVILVLWLDPSHLPPIVPILFLHGLPVTSSQISSILDMTLLTFAPSRNLT